MTTLLGFSNASNIKNGHESASDSVTIMLGLDIHNAFRR